MQEFFEWFTHMEHTKPFVLVLFFVTFIGILVYVFWGKQRSERIENHKFIPFDDDDDN
ncbi:MAG: cbb3-type cytochrome c oxidase subunit 3 [Gammaproteobacteria bacterium]|jgi:cbb3-type cytochrome oxidase subunit 3